MTGHRSTGGVRRRWPTHRPPAAVSRRSHGQEFRRGPQLVRTVADDYTGTGVDSPDDKGPTVISTLKVLNHLGDDVDAAAGETVNFENMKGSDALGEHQAAVILGSPHFGDAVPEKWALFAGESAERGEGRGEDLNYGSDVANEYLRYMREDHVMQAVLRAGRNDQDTYDYAHTARMNDELYNRRWLSETCFSVVKRSHGPTVRAQTWYREFRECVLLFAIYNVERASSAL